MISIFSDGSSEGNSIGAIGWAYIIVRENEILDCGAGGHSVGTNNVAELMAAIEGLRAFKKLKEILPHFGILDDDIELVSDSQYVLGITNGQFRPTKNLSLAKEIKALGKELKITTRWVKGHNGDFYNEKCDELAKHEKLKQLPEKLAIKKIERRKRRSIIKEFKKSGIKSLAGYIYI